MGSTTGGAVTGTKSIVINPNNAAGGAVTITNTGTQTSGALLSITGAADQKAVDVIAGNVRVADEIEAGTLTDGTLSTTGGAVTGATDMTASGTITGGTLTDGDISMTGGAVTGATDMTASGTITGGTLTDGTLSLTGGAVTG